jgi:hypothetical protein
MLVIGPAFSPVRRRDVDHGELKGEGVLSLSPAAQGAAWRGRTARQSACGGAFLYSPAVTPTGVGKRSILSTQILTQAPRETDYLNSPYKPNWIE